MSWWMHSTAKLVAAGAFLHLLAAPSQHAASAVPLAPGSSWTYKGTLTWAPQGVAQPDPLLETKTIEWRTEVVRVIRRNGIVAGHLRGLPLDLMNYPDGPGNYVMLQMADGRVFLIESERADAVLQRLDNAADQLERLAHPSEMLFDGKATGSCADCWKVSAFALERRSLSGHRTIYFKPGIGITRFTLEHRPSRRSIDVKLAGRED